MNIVVATNHFLKPIIGMFGKYGEISVMPKDFRLDKPIDLLILTGGEDIHPKYYGSDRQTSWSNEERDAFEYKLLRSILSGRIHAGKVFGICRGLQMLNVSLGGSLVFDIAEKYGRQHAPVHEISWQTHNIFSDITLVNSMHHQCIANIGDYAPFKILGIEPCTGTIEAILWMDKFFGVQFHPELVSNSLSETMDAFAKGIVDWAKMESSIISFPKKRTVSSSVKKTNYSKPVAIELTTEMWQNHTEEDNG